MLRLQSDDLFGSIKDKLKRSKATLFPLIEKIENENPEQFTRVLEKASDAKRGAS